MCSKRMARARDRGPKLTTTVISTTRAAGRDVMMRRILGRWSEASTWLRRSIRARTRSVVQGTICLGGREPASISTITWANCLGHAGMSEGRTWPGAAGVAAGPAGPGGPGDPAGSASPGGWLLTCGLAWAAARATGHAAPWVSQS